jgi:glycosyltransferase involved in cell wall biosynthesis
MPGLSVALIFCDEAPKLPAWLAAVQPFADEICALDSGSSDQGPDILKAAGARVEFQPWLGYGRQRNRAAGFCQGDWILFLDADERPDAALRQTLLEFKRQPASACMGYELEYKVFFFGRFLRHGGFFPERHLRLVRKGRGLWSEREVHEKLLIEGPTALLRGGFVEHHSYAAIGEYLRKMERYSAQAARQMYLGGRRTTPLKAAAHGGFAFVQRYFLRFGFLDGFAGYLAARLEGVYTLSKYTRLWELQQKEKP